MPGPVRILLMLDDGATFGPTDAMNNPNDTYFSLSEVVRTLQDVADPLHFVVTKAHRAIDPLYPPAPGGTVPPALDRFRADYSNFHFGAAHDLSTYDQIWFFGIAIGDANGLGVPSTLSQAEIDAVFTFMQGGGGVFATGDHWDMGAPLCGHLPRVRSMRRWFYGDVPARSNNPNYLNEGIDLGAFKGYSAPSALGPQRHDTTQPDIAGAFPFDAQSDAIPQPLRLVYQRTGGDIQFRIAHPLLCSAEGDIDTFPDHMHEGEADVPLPRDWANTIATPDGAVPEYPSSSGTEMIHGVETPLVRPTIIAYGRVIPGHHTPSSEPLAHVGDSTYDTIEDEFGTICVYDGVLEHVGRVVTDATFHHYFDINLIGDPVASDEKRYGFLQPGPGRYTDGPMMRKMRTYFRNLAVWLARPQSQIDILTRAATLVAAGHPFNEIAPAEAAYSEEAVMPLGAQAVVALRRLHMLCWTIASINIWLLYLIEVELVWPPPPPDPWWTHIIRDDPYRGVVNPLDVVQALLGGAVAELRTREGFAALRDRKNPKMQDALKRHVEAGFKRGAGALAARLEQRSKAFSSASLATRGEHAWTKRLAASRAGGKQ